MAKALNQSRMWASRAVFAVAIMIILFTRPTFDPHGTIGALCTNIGLLLAGLCAMGRVYATAFLGGHKNAVVIDYGPYSVVRNPLYVFSLLGFTGVALMSNHIILIIGLPVFFWVLYNQLIAREEAFLRETFGKAYDDYCTAVQRLIPDFKTYKAPETVTMSPKLLWNAFRDAVVWLLPYGAFQVIAFLQEQNWLPTL